MPQVLDAEQQSKNAERGTQNLELLMWRCPNCGQSYFGKHPPDLCDYCQDFTTWQPVES